MTPATVLGTLAHLGGRVERVLVVGCQPAVIDEGIGLSPPVAAAVDRAVDEVLDVLDARHDRRKGDPDAASLYAPSLACARLLVVVAVAGVVVKSAPDVARYLKIAGDVAR